MPIKEFFKIFNYSGKEIALKSESEKRLFWKTIIILTFSIIIYSFLIRLFWIWETFPYVYDNVEAWQYTQKSLIHLPKTGGRSTGGGQHLGPPFFWILWFFRVTIGQFFSNMPHAGGIGLVFLRALSDGLLFFAFRKRGLSINLAIAAILFYISFPPYLSLSRCGSNVDISHAFFNAAFALALINFKSKTTFQFILIAALSWIGAQMHKPTIVAFGGLMTWMLLEVWINDGFKKLVKRTFSLFLVIFILQLPFLYIMIMVPDIMQTATAGTGNMETVLNQSFTDRLIKSIIYIFSGANSFYNGDFSIFYPVKYNFMQFVLIITLFFPLIFWKRLKEIKDIIVIFYATLFLSIIAFTWLTVEYQSYWLSSATITIYLLPLVFILIVLKAYFNNVFKYISVLLLVIVLVLQPFRIKKSRNFKSHINTNYGYLVKGLKKITLDKKCISEIKTTFPIDYAMEGYEFMGGEKCEKMGMLAIIKKNGTVTYFIYAEKDKK